MSLFYASWGIWWARSWAVGLIHQGFDILITSHVQRSCNQFPFSCCLVCSLRGTSCADLQSSIVIHTNPENGFLILHKFPVGKHYFYKIHRHLHSSWGSVWAMCVKYEISWISHPPWYNTNKVYVCVNIPEVTPSEITLIHPVFDTILKWIPTANLLGSNWCQLFCDQNGSHPADVPNSDTLHLPIGHQLCVLTSKCMQLGVFCNEF